MSELSAKQLQSLEDRRLADSIKIDENTRIEDLETPDQLEERKIEVQSKPKKKRTAKKKVTKKGLAGVPSNLREKHPDAVPNPEVQVQIFERIIKSLDNEIADLVDESDNLELFIEYYPLFVTDECYQRVREIIYLANKVAHEKAWFTTLRDATMERTEDPLVLEDPKEPKKGFFKRLFS